TLVLHWGEAYPNTTSENNVLVVTARNQRFEDGILIDGWRRAGRLFWCPVKKDDEYEMEQHFGHSGITMWRENMKWSAWLQYYERPSRSRKQPVPLAESRSTADLSGATALPPTIGVHVNAMHISKVQDANVQTDKAEEYKAPTEETAWSRIKKALGPIAVVGVVIAKF